MVSCPVGQGSWSSLQNISFVGVVSGRVFRLVEPVCQVVAPLAGEAIACNVEVMFIGKQFRSLKGDGFGNRRWLVGFRRLAT